MKARLALVAALAFPLGLAAMPTAVEYLPSKISLKQGVKLGDGSVLPAGDYDVRINYKGFGSAAELQFFQGRVLKGKTNAEARGFPSTAPGGATDAYTVKQQKADAKIGDVKGTSADAKIGDIKGTSADVKLIKMNDPAAQKANQEVFPKVESSAANKKFMPAGAPGAFSWEKFGFREGQKGVVTPGPPSMLKLSFDSANSAAGFSAILPYIEPKRK